MLQFDAKARLQKAQSAPNYLSASKAGLPMRVLYFHNDVNGAPEELADNQGEIVSATRFGAIPLEKPISPVRSRGRTSAFRASTSIGKPGFTTTPSVTMIRMWGGLRPRTRLVWLVG